MKAFEVNYKCENCGNDWCEQYDCGIRIEQGSVYVCVIDIAKGILDRLFLLDRSVIVCPNCYVDEKIKVMDRKPIKKWSNIKEV